MSTAAHTPGAMRAARLLLPEEATRIYVHGPYKAWMTQSAVAEIIDRETAAPEMLEALEIALPRMLGPDRDKVQAAISKARTGQNQSSDRGQQ